MQLLIFLAVAIQIALLVAMVMRLRKRSLGSIGFLLLAATFVYHGLTEFAQVLFPDRNPYRDMTTTAGVANFTLLMSVAMTLFTLTYLLRLRRPAHFSFRELLERLDRTYLLKWPVLIGLGVPSFIFLLRSQADLNSGGYWTAGLAYQFTPIILTLSFATICLKLAGRYFLSVFIVFSILLIASGSRFEVIATALLAISAMVRYRVSLPVRTLLVISIILLVSMIAITASRGTYGRFNSGESLSFRLGAIATAIASPDDIRLDEILDDTIYRFDGNSFGALILERQSDGYGVTGMTQVITTLKYMIPSFLYPNKLDLEEYQRNEEAYAVEFYALPEIDYASDFWTMLLCYGGSWGLLMCGLVLGWVVAGIDNWLSGSSDPTAYIVGLGISTLPANLELGVAGAIYILRALAVLAVVAWLVSSKHKIALTSVKTSPPVPYLTQRT